ncbi:biogenesis of lysosome-related organelles complex 1 subunit 6 isoform X2 [Melopsittacus undulatus]|uniref:biogenesis of lysosome-related organelles complex 1 subunit 6 isoform X2 n=1 Tax=Melopsittacus undulatus TaxID=13146 RepID=UPI00146C2C25|nr:biogenesis of lysosome-related organelles complex 1 subunit 6 isoform X2 [Melopsittacus undulatus]
MSFQERPEEKVLAVAGTPVRSLDPSDASPDEGVVEDLPLIDEKAVEQLTEGLLSHYLPDLQRSKSALQEFTQNQVVLLETLEQEISKFKECHSILEIDALEENQPVQIFRISCCWRGCRTSIFPLNRKGSGKKKQAQTVVLIPVVQNW